MNERILAIDPGGEHVGLAWFEDGACWKAWELTPAEAVKYVRDSLDEKLIDVLVFEEFRLYPWMAETQVWSELPTVQLIGVIKYLWAEHGDASVKLVQQGATIKKPTRAILRARRTVSIAKRDKTGGHAADAELHGYYYIGQQIEKEKRK